MKRVTENDDVFEAFDDILRIVFDHFGIPGFFRGPTLARMKRHGHRETREFMMRVAAPGIRGVLDTDELAYIRNVIDAHAASVAEREIHARVLAKARQLGLAHPASRKTN